MSSWPVAELDRVRRLRVLAGATRGAMYAERVLPASFDEVWAAAGDLETSLPYLVPAMRAFRLGGSGLGGSGLGGSGLGGSGLGGSGPAGRRPAVALGPLGTVRFEVVLEPGWCLMQSRFVLAGMAAAADGTGTRFAVLGGSRFPAARAARPVLRPLGDVLGRRFVDRLRRRLDGG